MKSSQRLIDELIAPFYLEWDAIREQAAKSHQLRDGQAERAIQQGLHLFRNLLEHCEGEANPLNCSERLAFIEQQAAKYAAFRQLDELFLEMKKMIASKRTQLKRSGL